MRGLRKALYLTGVFALCCSIQVSAQAPSRGGITDIEIVDLVPFEISFRFANRGPSQLNDVTGRVILGDPRGQRIEVIPIDRFSVSPEEDKAIVVSSRWGFQRTGIYVLEVVLDLGADALISDSLAFRILPVPLPLESAHVAQGEGLYTVYQQPINWGLTRVAAPDAWTIHHGDKAIVVAVLDSGIDASIPQLQESLWINEDEIAGNGIDDDRNGYIDDIRGWDFRDGDNSSLRGTALHWHGTFTAGIIAARPGELPIVGIAPGVRIMDVRFLDSNNEFLPSDWHTFVDAIEYAVDNGANIINLSLFADDRPPQYFENALRAAAASGVIIVGISGNTGRNGVLYPGKYDEVYAVSATTQDDQLARLSTYGPEVFVCAPGEKVVSFVPGGGTSTRTGTSFAAAHVSGVVALILSLHPELSAAQAMEVLKRSAIDLGTPGFDRSFGHGLINAFAALSR